MRKRSARGDSGFSLIEVMVATGLASILALIVFALKTITDKSNTSAGAYIQADAFRKQITSQLLNVNAWRNTLANNPAFSCIGSDCTLAKQNGPPVPSSSPDYYKYSDMASGNGPCTGSLPNAVCHGGFDIYDIYYDASAGNTEPYYGFIKYPTKGFGFNGAQCDGFSMTAPINRCPFRLVLWWKAICDSTSGTCRYPAVNVQGFTVLSVPNTDKAHRVPFKPGNYSINLTLPGTL
jgi:prepilin-type N-terminal cleavage/methylation domain-containing protein